MEEIVRSVDGSLSPIDQFYHEFGRALATWANVENELGRWFPYFTGMPWDMAIAVFHSARTFRPQVDMFKAALKHSSSEHSLVEFFYLVLKVATRYETFRNELAHHTVVVWAEDGPRAAPGGALDSSSSYSCEQIREGSVNLSSLRDLIRQVTYVSTAGMPTIKELTTKIRALPSLAVTR